MVRNLSSLPVLARSLQTLRLASLRPSLRLRRRTLSALPLQAVRLQVVRLPLLQLLLARIKPRLHQTLASTRMIQSQTLMRTSGCATAQRTSPAAAAAASRTLTCISARRPGTIPTETKTSTCARCASAGSSTAKRIKHRSHGGN